MFGLTGTVRTPLLDITITVISAELCARNLPKAASLSYWHFACDTAQWMLRSQEWQCSFRDYTAHFFVHVAHVVDQILLQMLRAEQMCQCAEDVKIHIGELVPLTSLASFTVFSPVFRIFRRLLGIWTDPTMPGKLGCQPSLIDRVHHVNYPK